LIHGTNNPLAVGMAVTHGCMRMYPEDIEAVCPLVPVGTKVRIVNEPVKVAFVDGELLLEVHPPVDSEGQTIAPDLEMFSKLLDQALGPTTAAVHWDFARETMQAANGLPTVVGLEADLDTTPQMQTVGTDAAGGTPTDGSASDVAPARATAPAAAPVTPGASPAAPSSAVVASAPAAGASSSPPATVTLPAPAVPAERTAAPLPATPAQVMPPSVTTLPAPAMPAADPSAPPSSSGTRTFPAGDPETSTAHPAAPASDAAPGTAVTPPDRP
jgi:hypothetical protein